MALRTFPLLSLSSLLLAAFLLAGAPAAAYPDARVEAKITPNFGALIKPPLRHSHRRYTVWRPPHWRDYRYSDGYDYGHGYPYPYPPGYPYPPIYVQPVAQVLSVDCGNASAGPTPIGNALAQLATGGSLYIRGVCRETVQILRPVTLVGEEASAFAPAAGGRPTIAAPPGAPCVFIAPGVLRVEIRGLRLSSEGPSRSACVDSQDAQAAIVSSEIDYAGGEAAVAVTGGRLILRGVRIDAPNAGAGVVVEQGILQAESSQVRAGGVGLDLSLDPREPSSLTGVSLSGPGLGAPGALRSTGVLVHGGAPSRLAVSAGYVEGFATGMWFDTGSAVDVSGSKVRRSNTAVVVDGGDVKVTDSILGGRDVVVWAASGRAFIDHNVLYGYARGPIHVSPGAWFFGRNSYRGRCGRFEQPGDCRRIDPRDMDLRDDDGPAWR